MAGTEITLAQSSGPQTPPPEQNNATDEVASTPQPPDANMRFDSLLEAERHYKMYARMKGFAVRYNYRKKSEVSDEYIRAGMVCHKAGIQAKKKRTHRISSLLFQRE